MEMILKLIYVIGKKTNKTLTKYVTRKCVAYFKQ